MVIPVWKELEKPRLSSDAIDSSLTVARPRRLWRIQQVLETPARLEFVEGVDYARRYLCLVDLFDRRQLAHLLQT